MEQDYKKYGRIELLLYCNEILKTERENLKAVKEFENKNKNRPLLFFGVFFAFLIPFISHFFLMNFYYYYNPTMAAYLSSFGLFFLFEYSINNGNCKSVFSIDIFKRVGAFLRDSFVTILVIAIWLTAVEYFLYNFNIHYQDTVFWIVQALNLITLKEYLENAYFKKKDVKSLDDELIFIKNEKTNIKNIVKRNFSYDELNKYVNDYQLDDFSYHFMKTSYKRPIFTGSLNTPITFTKFDSRYQKKMDEANKLKENTMIEYKKE